MALEDCPFCGSGNLRAGKEWVACAGCGAKAKKTVWGEAKRPTEVQEAYDRGYTAGESQRREEVRLSPLEQSMKDLQEYLHGEWLVKPTRLR